MTKHNDIAVSGKSRYASEVHLGLLVIIFVLLFLDVTSNYVIYRARQTQRSVIVSRLQMAALATARRLQSGGVADLTETDRAQIVREFELNEIVYWPLWRANAPGQFSIPLDEQPGDRPGLVQLQENDVQPRHLTELGDARYAYLYPTGSDNRPGAVVVISRDKALSYLNGAGRVVPVVSALAALAVLVVYFLLARFILKPYRRMAHEAAQAGRGINPQTDQVYALIDDYRVMIDQLEVQETELRRLNQQVNQRADSLERYNDYLLQSMSSGVVTVASDGRIRSANPAALTILGQHETELVGMHYFDALQGNVDIVNALSRAIDCGKPTIVREVSFASVDGLRLMLGVSVSPVNDEGHEPVGAALLINDLTESVELRHELESKNRLAALGEMAGGLAHQLRNSIGAIVGYARLVAKKMTRAELNTANIEALAFEVKEAEILVDRFLSFARPLDFQPIAVSAKVIVDEVVESFRARVTREALDIQCSGDFSIMLWADALLLKQALANLLDNAANAYDAGGGTIEVEVRKLEGWVAIKVTDRASGISSEEQSKIFTPFYSSRPAGTGLGLPLVAKIVDLHGGRIKLKSAPGEGTTFLLYIAPADAVHTGLRKPGAAVPAI